MNDLPFTGESEQDCLAALWRTRLAGIPSTFGRLLYFSSQRDFNTGRYSDANLAERFGDDEVDRVLRHSHEVAFNQWLNYTIEQQSADLDLYLSALWDNKRTVLRTWLRLEPYRNLIPEEARDEERQLFLADIEAVLAIMRVRFSVRLEPEPYIDTEREPPGLELAGGTPRTREAPAYAPRILIIEDEPQVRDLFVKVLAEGWLRRAGDGHGAARSHVASGSCG